MNGVEISFVWWAILHLVLCVSMSMFRITGNVPGASKHSKLKDDSDPASGGAAVDKGKLYFTKFHLAQTNMSEYSGVILALMAFILLKGAQRRGGVRDESVVAAYGAVISRTLQTVFIIVSPNAHKFDLKKAVAVTAGYLFFAFLIVEALMY